MRNRSGGAARLENTFDYTSTSTSLSAMYHPDRVSLRIPGEGQFSRRTEKNTLVDGDNAVADNGTSSTVIGELFTSPGALHVERASNQSINYDVTPGRITKSSDHERDAFALLSKIVLSEPPSATERSVGLRCGFRTPASVSGNINASGNTSLGRENLSAAAIRNDNARDEKQEGNANAFARIPVAAAFMRSPDPSSSGEISKEESSVTTTRPRSRGDPSMVVLLEARDRGSSSANERMSESSASLRDSRDQRGVSNSHERMSKVANLRNSHSFSKPRGKLSKWKKDTEKFRGAKSAGKSRHYEDFLAGRESRRNRREFASETPARRKRYLSPGRPRGYLRNEDSDSAIAEGGKPDSRRKTQVFVDYRVRPKVT